MKSQGQAAETETCKYKVESQNPLCIQLTTQTPAEFLCPSGLSYAYLTCEMGAKPSPRGCPPKGTDTWTMKNIIKRLGQKCRIVILLQTHYNTFVG